MVDPVEEPTARWVIKLPWRARSSGRQQVNSAAATQAMPSPAPEAEQQAGSWMKEFTTTVIAISIMLATIWVLVQATRGANSVLTISKDDLANAALLDKRIQLHQQAQANRKDILTVGVGLLSVILGFYFGRVPSERRAERAEREVTRANATANQAMAGISDAEQHARSAEQKADAAAHERERAKEKVQDAIATVSKIKQSLASTANERHKTLSAAGAPLTPDEVDQAVDNLDAFLERMQ